MQATFAQMKHFIFLAAISCLLSACNGSGDDSSKKDEKASAQNQLPASTQTLQKQIQQNPDSPGLRFQLAFALDSIGMYQQALQQMDSLIQKDSLNYGFWFAKGNIAEDARDTLLAMNSYARAAHIYESPDALLALANLYAETKNERAIQVCSRVKLLGLGRNYDASCAFIVGVYYARIRKPDEAIKYFDECIANNYTYMEAYIEKGLLFFDKQQYEKALGVFHFASTVNNLYADAYYYQARCYEMLNKKDSAILMFRQSLQLDPNMQEAREHLKGLSG